MSQMNLDLDSVRVRRDVGIQRAVDHADDVDPTWSERAYAFLQKFLRNEPGAFLTEDVALGSLRDGLSPPPDGRAWGGVIQRAAKRGAIRKVGYAPARTSNLSPKVLWEAA